MKPLALTTPPSFQCYDCLGCGECCRGRFAILISKEDRDRIEGQGWNREELGLGSEPLFSARGKSYQLAHRGDGACIFLDEAGRCRIHARFGEPAKPLPCRLYPFRFVSLGSQVRVDVRFDCPATAGNIGRPIPGYRSELMGLMRQVVPPQAANQPAPPLYARVQPTWAQLCRITEAFQLLLGDDTFSLTLRIVNMVNLSALLRSPRIVTMEGRKLSEFLESISAKLVETGKEDPLRKSPPLGMLPSAFRQLLGTYGRIDQVGEKPNYFVRLRNSWRMLAGKGVIPALRNDFPAVTFEDIDGWAVTPVNGAADAIERYLMMRLTSMGFFGQSFYNRAYLEGMNALLLTYPLICWFSRAFALGKGLHDLDAASVERAIQVVDHQHGITPVLNIASERRRMNLLCERANLRSFVVWYGS